MNEHVSPLIWQIDLLGSPPTISILQQIMADSTPLISEGRKKEGKQGHRKVRVSIFYHANSNYDQYKVVSVFWLFL